MDESTRTAVLPSPAEAEDLGFQFDVTDVTGTHHLSVTLSSNGRGLQRDLPAADVARALAARMSLPDNVPWVLRDEASGAFLDEGRAIGEDYTLALAAKLVLRHKRGPVVTNLSTSLLVDAVAREAGVAAIRALYAQLQERRPQLTELRLRAPGKKHGPRSDCQHSEGNPPVDVLSKDDPRVHDYLQLGINSPRGKAVEAALAYAAWVAGHIKKHDAKQNDESLGFAVMPEVDAVLGNREKLGDSLLATDGPRVRVADIMRVRETAPHLASGFATRARAFVEVQNG